MAPAIFCRLDDRILTGSVISGTAPSTSYTISDLISQSPERRILFGATSATITFTRSSATGTIVVLPVSNCDPAVVSITNGAGLNAPFPQPALPPNSIPLTAMLDLTGLGTLTSTVWNLVIAANSVNVLLGGGFEIYSTKRTLAHNFQWDFRESEDHKKIEHENDYGIRLRYDLRTLKRIFEYVVRTSDTGLSDLRAFYRANHSQPGVFWPDPAVNDGIYGTWEGFEVNRRALNNNLVTLTLHELVKGSPV